MPPHFGTRHLIFDLVEASRSEEHTSELQSQSKLVCRLLLEKKNTQQLLFACPSPKSPSERFDSRRRLDVELEVSCDLHLPCAQRPEPLGVFRGLSDDGVQGLGRAPDKRRHEAVTARGSRRHPGVGKHQGHAGAPALGHEVKPDLGFHENFFFSDAATTEIYTLSLHDALPI